MENKHIYIANDKGFLNGEFAGVCIFWCTIVTEILDKGARTVLYNDRISQVDIIQAWRMDISLVPMSGSCHYDLIRLKANINFEPSKIIIPKLWLWFIRSVKGRILTSWDQLLRGGCPKLLLSAGQNNSWRRPLNYPMTEQVFCLHSFILNFLSRNSK